MARFEMVTCADGFYCVYSGRQAQLQRTKNRYQPRIRKCVELGFPNRPVSLSRTTRKILRDLTDTVYGYVPAHIVRKMIAAHGGIVSGECPPLVESG